MEWLLSALDLQVSLTSITQARLFIFKRKGALRPVKAPNWLRQMPECLVEAHGLGFDSYCWLNVVDYLVLVMADSLRARP